MRILLIWLTVSCAAQPWSGLIDPSRAIDWTYVGVPGGIPTTRTQCGSTILASTYGDGASNATTGIQNSINACSANTYVLLGPGTFRINTSLTVPSNITLRGSGAHLTRLDGQGSSNQVVNLGNGSNPATANSTGISSGSTKGSTSFVVSSATGISVGTMLMVTELNDASYVDYESNNGSCTWCDGGIGWNGTRVRGQIVEVSSVAGTTIGFAPPLYSDYTATPLATRFSASAKYAGVEDLEIYANDTGYTTNINMQQCAYCWVKGVRGNFADGDHVRAYWSLRCEIRDSYFHDSFVHAAGNTEGSIFIANKSSGVLIENNILRRQHVAIMFNWGAAGNVAAYNYADGAYDTSAPNAILGDISMHGAHPQFNLLEGNDAIAFYPDSVWGTSSHSTAFRNWFRGTTQVCLPYDSRSTPGACHYAWQAARAVQIAYTVSSTNLLGNVVGSQEQEDLVNGSSSPLGSSSSITAPTSRSYDTTTYNYTWGYDNLSDGGGADNTPGLSFSTRFLHGDYSRTSGAITWDAGNANHTLPSSFYLASKPSWFRSIAYPPMGSDVSSGAVSGVGNHVNKIPARACYEAIVSDVFNPLACYFQNSGLASISVMGGVYIRGKVSQ